METQKTTNIFFAGVGGQGLVLANALTSAAAIASGLDVKTSDIYGLAMRGGAVYGFHRHGNMVYSSTFAAGEGDILVALEPLEGLRWAGMMRKGATALVNNRPLFPSPVLLEKEPYPEAIPSILANATMNVIAFDALSIAAGVGSERMVNSVLLGQLALLLPYISLDFWRTAFEQLLEPPKVESNWMAFQKGLEVTQ